MTIRLLAIFTALLFCSAEANAHGGGLDSLGCHHDRKAGGYHCHRGKLAGQSFGSKEEALSAKPPKTAPVIEQAPAPGHQAEPYSRSLYRHWIDADHDCQNTRQEVLIEESLEPAILDAKGCKVRSGRWYDPYTDKTVTDPTELDIDHYVPLAEVHRSGGYAWNSAKREAYANDLTIQQTLIAVKASANRSKSDNDPAGWLPSNEAYRCEYVTTWVAIKKKWGLVMDVAEMNAVIAILQGCK